MKHPFVLFAACVAALALPAAAAAAPTPAPLHAQVSRDAPATVGANAGDRAPLLYVPLARMLTGTGTISLNVYQFNGTAEANAEAHWWVVEDTDSGTGYATTDASGHVDLTGVPAASSSNGEIAIWLDNADDGLYDLWNMSWPASGTSGGLQPGRLSVTMTKSSDVNWNYWDEARVRLFTSDGNGIHLARTDITRTGATTTGYARTITTGSETLSGGSIYFWDNEGMELSVSGTAVSSGTTASTSVNVREGKAQRIWTNGWGSGKPGSRTWLVMNNFPAGWTNSIGGIADWPDSATEKSFGTSTSAGDTYTVKSITIPSTVAPGYAYWLWADHTTGSLSLSTWFQTCTLNASKTTISRGGSIKLSGVIPTKGHLGSQRGISKRVIIYKTTKSTGQPTSWAPKSTIWTKVATVTANGLGRFTSGYPRPSRTTRYVVRYPGDAWYWGAFTSVRKVTVR